METTNEDAMTYTDNKPDEQATTYYPLINGSSKFDAVILANGEYPKHDIPLSLLTSAEYICCCDLAGETLITHGILPQAIVGDGDSLPEDFQRQYASIFHHVSEQDDNDLTKSTKFVASLGKKSIAYLGASGKREDHTLANISLMQYYYRQLHLRPTMITDYGWFTVAEGHCAFETFPRQQVSIFNAGCNRLENKGLRWPSFAYRELWQGSLNEAIGNKIEMDGDSTYIMFFTFDAK